MANVWMVRAGRGGENVDDFVKHGIVAIGFSEIGALNTSPDKDALLREAAANAPHEKEGTIASWVSQLVRFRSEVKKGDLAITLDRDRRLYLVGSVESDYEWTEKLLEGKAHIRRVKWTHKVPRDVLSVATRNTLGSSLTLFKLNAEAAEDLLAHRVAMGDAVPVVPPENRPDANARDGEAQVAAEVVEKADEFIEDAINALDWEDMQELVAGILRAMGYRTKVSPKGGDRGVDVFASPDGLGLQEPRIFVEVKHRQSQIGADGIRAFLGGRRAGDTCLYVSTGSFTKEARYEAERASVPTMLVDLQDLRRMLVDNYEQLDAETRALVPLRRLYWPAR